MTIPQVDTQYTTGVSRRGIERALAAAGKDLGRLAPADLWLLEDFHTMGRIATTQLVELSGITGDTEVLDAGTGIGGTARFVADRCLPNWRQNFLVLRRARRRGPFLAHAP